MPQFRDTKRASAKRTSILTGFEFAAVMAVTVGV
jgi:hypothetical protein